MKPPYFLSALVSLCLFITFTILSTNAFGQSNVCIRWLRELGALKGAGDAVSFSGNGKYLLAAGSGIRPIALFIDAATGKTLQVLNEKREGHKEQIYAPGEFKTKQIDSAQLNFDGTRALTYSMRRHGFQELRHDLVVWDTQTGRLVSKKTFITPIGNPSMRYRAVLSPTQNRTAFLSPEGIGVYDEKGNQLFNYPMPEDSGYPVAMAFSRNGDRLALSTRGSNPSLYILDAASGRLLGKYGPMSDTTHIHWVGPEDRFVVVRTAVGNEAALWDTHSFSTDTPAKRLSLGGWQHVSNDGKWIVASTVVEGKRQIDQHKEESFEETSWRPDGDVANTTRPISPSIDRAGETSEIGVWDLVSGRQISSLSPTNVETGFFPMQESLFSHEGRPVFITQAGEYGDYILWSSGTDGGRPQAIGMVDRREDFPRGVLETAVRTPGSRAHPAGAALHFVTASDDGRLLIAPYNGSPGLFSVPELIRRGIPALRHLHYRQDQPEPPVVVFEPFKLPEGFEPPSGETPP